MFKQEDIISLRTFQEIYLIFGSARDPILR